MASQLYNRHKFLSSKWGGFGHIPQAAEVTPKPIKVKIMSSYNFVNSGQTKKSIINTDWKFPSDERLRSYLLTCKQDRNAAIHLYAWNIAISTAFYPPLQVLEVTLRESLIIALENEFGQEWYMSISDVLDSRTVLKIHDCKSRLVRKTSSTSFLSIANELTFGFWVSLVAPSRKQNYTDNISHFELYLWRPALRAAFAFKEDLELKRLRTLLSRVKRLRNLVFHHEPIYLRELEEEYRIILDVIGWMSPRARSWVEGRSRVLKVLNERNNLEMLKF